MRKLRMRQSYRIIPIYTADVSGVCSALYELGGMVVMHDPSGCNSTYNTHDEIRWYDQDSLIYISGLTEIDAVMGNDEKLLHDIKEAARELKPRFIALAGSPIPYMSGTDFSALAEILETELGIPAFAVPTNGMHDYTYGAGIALEKIAEKFIVSAEKGNALVCPGTLNLLGVTPLDFGPQEQVDVMKQNLEEKGWRILSTWAMGDSLDELVHAGEAEVNLAVSSVGLRAAKILKEKFGTPYVVGTPVGDFTDEICEALNKKDGIPFLENRLAGKPEITLIGDAVTMGSLAAVIEKKCQKAVQVICPLETHDGLLSVNDTAAKGEEEMESLLKDSKIIAADPLYRPICPKDSQFYELPHIAFSGRIFLKKIKEGKGFLRSKQKGNCTT